MKNREAINMYNFLNSMQGKKELSLIPEEWKILSENREKIQDALSDLDKKRRELVKKYSSSNEKEEVVKVDDGNIELFEKDYLELLDEKLDLKLETISLDNIGDKMSSEMGIWEFMRYMVSK